MGVGRFGCGAGVRRDRRARRHDRAAQGRSARSAQGVPHRGFGDRRAGRADRDGQGDRPRRAGRPALGHQVRRSGHADLYVGNHRQAQGLPADARQPGLRDPRRQGLLPHPAGQGRAPAGLPAAGPRARAGHHHRGIREQGDARIHQRHQEPRADVRGVQADAGGLGAASLREGLQHRRAERPQRRQGPDLRDRGEHRDRVEPGQGQRRCGSAAARQARAVRSAGLRQAARRPRR